MQIKVINTNCKYAFNALDGNCYCTNQEESSFFGIKFMKCKNMLCENNKKCDHKMEIKYATRTNR